MKGEFHTFSVQVDKQTKIDWIEICEDEQRFATGFVHNLSVALKSKRSIVTCALCANHLREVQLLFFTKGKKGQGGHSHYKIAGDLHGNSGTRITVGYCVYPTPTFRFGLLVYSSPLSPHFTQSHRI